MMSDDTDNRGASGAPEAPVPAPQPAAPAGPHAAPGAKGGDRREIWKRGLLMLVFLICFVIGHTLVNVIAVVQFIWLAVYMERNEALARFGAALGLWLADAARYLSVATEDKPFPWAAWPGA